MPALRSRTIAVEVEAPARKCTKLLVVAVRCTGVVTGVGVSAGVGVSTGVATGVGVAEGVGEGVRLEVSSTMRLRWPMAKAASVRPPATRASTNTPERMRSVRRTRGPTGST